MTWILLVVSAVLAAVAAVGILRPFSRGRAVMLEPMADPLEDERLSLLRALRDLERDREAGVLDEGDYRALRAETESRAVGVLRALEARDGAGRITEGLSELRASRDRSTDGDGEPVAARRSRLVPIALVGVVAVAAVSLALSSALRDRTADQPITGGIDGESALSFFERRVAEHPEDLAARLDLADLYLRSGNVRPAIDHYLVALRIDPRNTEARAKLGFVLFSAGEPARGLEAVEGALDIDPDYPEALYYKGVILLRGLDRPQEAVEAFRAYLDAAPFGARRAEVERLLQEAEDRADEVGPP